MEQRLIELMEKARSQQVVAIETLENGMQMLVYPLPEGVIVGVGYPADLAHQVQAENVLRMRSANMPRFGAWLPAMLADGAQYVVRRVADPAQDGEASDLSEDDLQAAQELLA